MTREELESLVADVLGEQFARLKVDLMADIERAVAAKPIPPFVPPAPWVAGYYGAGLVVRHRGGIFYARRDTDGEPGIDDAWLSLLNGYVGCSVRWHDDRTLAVRHESSDGALTQATTVFPVPISRGAYDGRTLYQVGDRVTTKTHEWEAIAQTQGNDPTDPTDPEVRSKFWRKVSVKRLPNFRLDDDGNLTAGGEQVGSIKALVTKVLTDLVDKSRQ